MPFDTEEEQRNFAESIRLLAELNNGFIHQAVINITGKFKISLILV